MSIKHDTDKFIDHAQAARGVGRVKINCTEKWARRVFEIKDGPLVYRGVELECETLSRAKRKKAEQERAEMERNAQTDAFQ